MIKSQNRTFEENYFKGYFRGAVGKFSKKDLEISRNWFWGWLKKLNQYVPIKRGDGRAVLEIGCAIGGVASILQERGFDVYASDISDYAINRAQKLSKGVNFLAFDVQNSIPLDKKFDIIIAFEVVEHLKNPEKAIKNIFMSLKKNGKIVFSTPPLSLDDKDPTHISVKNPKEWIKIMKKVGFKNIAYHRFSLLPFFYRFNKRFHIIFPFAIPLSFVNKPIFYIGEKM